MPPTQRQAATWQYWLAPSHPSARHLAVEIMLVPRDLQRYTCYTAARTVGVACTSIAEAKGDPLPPGPLLHTRRPATQLRAWCTYPTLAVRMLYCRPVLYVTGYMRSRPCHMNPGSWPRRRALGGSAGQGTAIDQDTGRVI